MLNVKILKRKKKSKQTGEEQDIISKITNVKYIPNFFCVACLGVISA